MLAKPIYIIMCFGLILSTPLLAQVSEEQIPETDTIIVTGEALPKTETVRDSIRQIRPASSASNALAKFNDPLCLGFAGIDKPTADKMRRLIERRAALVKLPIAGDKCTTNALIIVVDDPAEFIVFLKKTQPKLISAAQSRRIEAALVEGDPVLNWWTQEPRTSLGRKMPESSTIPGLTVPMAVSAKINTDSRPRRVGLNQSAAIVNAIMLFDAKYLKKMTIGQISDYAVMRMLAPSRIAAIWEGKTPSSIMRLFATEAQEAPTAMTRFDIAYLLALYDLPLNAASSRLAPAVLAAYEDKE